MAPPVRRCPAQCSGLGQIEGQLSPRPLPLWEGAGTDEMRLVHKRVELRGGKNCPRLDGQEVRLSITLRVLSLALLRAIDCS